MLIHLQGPPPSMGMLPHHRDSCGNSEQGGSDIDVIRKNRGRIYKNQFWEDIV